ncbi:hypothetical protein CON00_00875 [Bacillus sp. AFS096315]|nr:hypothetical protein CON00_00875 [Bacillus sp. AFS096315]
MVFRFDLIFFTLAPLICPKIRLFLHDLTTYLHSWRGLFAVFVILFAAHCLFTLSAILFAVLIPVFALTIILFALFIPLFAALFE